jgi:hypothetical protein
MLTKHEAAYLGPVLTPTDMLHLICLKIYPFSWRLPGARNLS